MRSRFYRKSDRTDSGRSVRRIRRSVWFCMTQWPLQKPEFRWGFWTRRFGPGIQRIKGKDPVVTTCRLRRKRVPNVPNLPCTVIFNDIEWKALCCYINKTTTLPEKPPTLEEAIRMVAWADIWAENGTDRPERKPSGGDWYAWRRWLKCMASFIKRHVHSHLRQPHDLKVLCVCKGQIWASETKDGGSSAAGVGFYDGGRLWGHQSYSYGSRVLPVRSDK
jgi:hypothetical protein